MAQTSIDVLVALLAVKELEIKTLHETVNFLSTAINNLRVENDGLYKENIDLYTELDALDKIKKEHNIGFKNDERK
ncbi:MAG: hypothetical protein JJE53_02350 [Candidatus Pacebacteria bacterium]|nr:hypothetical protein [Candidatus Paceibacterota bacterium]